MPAIFGAMELRKLNRDGERGSFFTPYEHSYGDLCLCLGKVDKQDCLTPFLPCLGRNVCRLKSGWLLQALSPEKRRPV